MDSHCVGLSLCFLLLPACTSGGFVHTEPWSGPCIPATELLTNGGFESGSLQSWNAFVGKGQVVTSVQGAGQCRAGGPAQTQARSGKYAFSASALDGAEKDQTEIVLSQAVSVADAKLPAGAGITASAFATRGCEGPYSGAVQIIVSFLRGGANGTEIGQTFTDAVELTTGEWQQASPPPHRIPEGTDTIVLYYRSAHGTPQTPIHVWSDDLSLAVCSPQGEPLAAWMPRPSQGAQAEPSSKGCLSPSPNAPPAVIELPGGGSAELAPYGHDESDGSGVHWNQGFPAPCMDDDPNRRGLPNAAWRAGYTLRDNELCLSASDLHAEYPPSHTLRVGYSVTLRGAAFEDGSTNKDVVLLEFNGSPKREASACVRLKP